MQHYEYLTTEFTDVSGFCQHASSNEISQVLALGIIGGMLIGIVIGIIIQKYKDSYHGIRQEPE
jgi:F0F1-type ATP synthase assembly protein I